MKTNLFTGGQSVNNHGRLIVLGGPTYPAFTKKVIDYLMTEHPDLDEGEDLRLAKTNGELRHVGFPSGAICPELPQVRECDVFIIDPLRLTGDDLWAVSVMADAARMASASRVTAVMPFLEGRQDRKHERGVCITASLALRLMKVAGVSRFLSLDLHSRQIQGMTDLQFDTVFASVIFLPIMKELQRQYGDVIVMGPDHGSVERNGFFANKLNCEVGFVDKRRGPDRQPKIFGVAGDVARRTVFLVDDMIDTAKSFVEAAKIINAQQATRIFGFATHPVLSTKDEITASQRLNESPLEKIYVCDTLQLPPDLSDKVEVVSAAPLIADAIYLVYTGGSISSLFIKG